MSRTSRTVVVGLDASPLGESAFFTALDEARGGSVLVIHVIGGFDPLASLEYAAAKNRLDLEPQKQKLEARVSELLGRATPAQPASVERHLAVGQPPVEILRVARTATADLIVVGTHGRTGVGRLVLGSVAERLVREAGCSVLVVREKRWS
jgi:nucleotide-binding universal stress UspA family protein